MPIPLSPQLSPGHLGSAWRLGWLSRLREPGESFNPTSSILGDGESRADFPFPVPLRVVPYQPGLLLGEESRERVYSWA